MALIELDTRLPLMAQVPQIDFNQLANNTLNMYDTMQQRGQQGILSRLIAQNTKDGQIDLNNALKAVQSNPNQAYQPALINTLTGMIQQQNAAQLKAKNDQLKVDADLNKTYAETGKIKNEGVGKGLENSEKKFGALNQIFQAAALSGSKNNILLGLNGALKSGLIDQDMFNQQQQIIQLMTPEEIRSYASNITLGNSKDPASYLFQTANNAADNKVSEANNIRTNQTTQRGQTLDFNLGKDKLAQDQKQFNQSYALDAQKAFFEQNKPIGFETGNDGYQYAIYPNGKGIRVLGEDGKPIKVQAKGVGGMNSTIQKAILETDDVVSASKNAINNLKDALKYSDLAYDGVGASQRALAAGTFGLDQDRATATTMLDNIAKGNALEQLKATFGGAPTEGERAILLQLQGSANLPKAQREAIYNRAIQLAEARLKSNQEKANSLRGGTYFQPNQNGAAVPEGQNLFGLFD